MRAKAGMISRKEDGGECWKRWFKTREAHLLTISGKPPEGLCQRELNLTVCFRYAESLKENKRVLRYLNKYHAVALHRLDRLLTEFEKASRS